MYITRIFKISTIVYLSIKPVLLFSIYSAAIVFLFSYYDIIYLKIPWVPISLIGIAVAFYVGFKNNSAYDRTWEARKIWGGIVNTSRSWAIMVNGFVTNEFAAEKIEDQQLHEKKKTLVFRHIAWLYRLKRQLRVIKPWEHDANLNKEYRKLIAERFPTENEEVELTNYIDQAEASQILKASNGCSQLLNKQTELLRQLKKEGLIDDFRHVEMQRMLTELFGLQGKCERIKNFPLPRQYASLSIYFVYIFIFLLPMGLLSAFTDAKLDDSMMWGVVPFTALIGWIFWMMESVGDYAENPFENLAFDTPMTSLTRTIEIDLLEMLNEKEIPKPIGPIDDFVV